MSESTFFTFAALALGLCVGSFLYVVIHRLPKMLEQRWKDDCADLAGAVPAAAPRYNLVLPRSACPACGHRITALENVPVLSWLALRGKCSACRAPISPRYPVVEIVGGLLAVAAYWQFGATPTGVAAAVFLCDVVLVVIWLAAALTMPPVPTRHSASPPPSPSHGILETKS